MPRKHQIKKAVSLLPPKKKRVASSTTVQPQVHAPTVTTPPSPTTIPVCANTATATSLSSSTISQTISTSHSSTMSRQTVLQPVINPLVPHSTSASSPQHDVVAVLEAIGKPVASNQEEEERNRGKSTEEEEREDEDVEEERERVYKVLGRLTVQGKHYLVSDDEVKRRVKGENMSANVFRALIRVGRKDLPKEVLQQPKKAKTKVTIFSALTEGEAQDLAEGFGTALVKHVPKDKVLQGIPTEDIPTTLRTIQRMRRNFQTLGGDSSFDLTTHRFGPAAAEHFFFLFREEHAVKFKFQIITEHYFST